MGKVAFVAWLYVMGLSGLFIGGLELFEKMQFSWMSERAVMKSSDLALTRAAKFAPGQSAQADVVYETPGGPIAVNGKFLSGDHVQALARGESIRLRFLKSNPHRTLYDRDELPSGFKWLVVGTAVFGAAVVAHRLLRREFAK
ncbi:hypothetical protein [Polaromonas sp. YR568]|uniref:hypothetical protein n=1 Tax=Polaromonas sp. YR568 TaxID=1855301 RepID=UPI0031382092